MQTHATETRRKNRVYKSLHKPLTYLGVERTLFYFVCVGAVGAFNLSTACSPAWLFSLADSPSAIGSPNSDPALSAHPRQIGTVQEPVRRGETEHSARGGDVMLRLDKVIKPWKESAALCDHINLYGFWNETAFLTKSGDLGMVLSVAGVDYESLDHAEQEYAVKRLGGCTEVIRPRLPRLPIPVQIKPARDPVRQLRGSCCAGVGGPQTSVL